MLFAVLSVDRIPILLFLVISEAVFITGTVPTIGVFGNSFLNLSKQETVIVLQAKTINLTFFLRRAVTSFLES